VLLEATEACGEVVVAPVTESGCEAVAALRAVLGPPMAMGLREPGAELGPRVTGLFRAGGTVDVEAGALATLVAPGVSVMLEATEACAAVLVTASAEGGCESVAAPKDAFDPSAGSCFRDTGVKLARLLKELF